MGKVFPSKIRLVATWFWGLIFCCLVACQPNEKQGSDSIVATNPSARSTKIDSIESLRSVAYGKTLIEQHEYVDAFAAFTTAIQTFERNAEAYRCRAWVDLNYLHPGEPEAGVADWKEALELDPMGTPGSPLAWQPEPPN